MGFSRESLRQHGAIDLVGVLRRALDLLRSSRAALRMTDLRERLKNAKLKASPTILAQSCLYWLRRGSEYSSSARNKLLQIGDKVVTSCEFPAASIAQIP